MLRQIRIVLVDPSHPGNIGAVARAMKNMGLTDLWLVNPKAYPGAEATARASGADDLLAQAHVVGSLTVAIADCGLVIGASARHRGLDRPAETPALAARYALKEAVQHRVAFVFGREHSGLKNMELDLCHRRLSIPVNAEFPSLNLAAAVQVVAYELRMAMLANANPIPNPDLNDQELFVEDLASAAEMDRFYAHLETVLQEIKFLNPDRPRKLMRRLRRLYQRARPDRNEVNILRGILSAVQSRTKSG